MNDRAMMMIVRFVSLSVAIASVVFVIILLAGFGRVSKFIRSQVQGEQPIALFYAFLPWIEILMILTMVARGRVVMGFWPYAPYGHGAMELPMHPQGAFDAHFAVFFAVAACNRAAILLAGAFYLICLLARSPYLWLMFTLQICGLALVLVHQAVDPFGWMAWIID